MKGRIVGGALLVGLAVMLVLNLVWIGKNRHSLGGTKMGEPAPDVTLPLLDGGNVRVSQYRGHPLVLSFWATWCGPCIQEMPDVQRVYDEEKDKGVALVAVNVNGGSVDEVAPAVREFRQKLHLTLPIAVDEGAASQAYRVDTIPRTVIVGKDGHIAQVLDGAHSLDDLREAIDSVH